MRLALIHEISDLLTCPFRQGCFGHVEYREGVSRCRSCGETLGGSDGLAVLVDFRRSLLSEAIVRNGSPVRRRSGRSRHMLDRIWGGASASQRASRVLVAEAETRFTDPQVLIVGGGISDPSFRRISESLIGSAIAFDVYPRPDVTFIADAHNIPLRSSSVDIVVCQAVLEHVLDPTGVVREIHRVLKRGGLVYVELPFMQSVHEGAYDFFRFSHTAQRWLFRDFVEINSGVLKGAWTALVWSIRSAAYALTGSWIAASAVTMPFTVFRLLDRFGRHGPHLDGACELYFLGVKHDVGPLKPASLPQYFADTRNQRKA